MFNPAKRRDYGGGERGRDSGRLKAGGGGRGTGRSANQSQAEAETPRNIQHQSR